MTLRTVLCFGDSNTHGTAPIPDAFAPRVRFGRDGRWPAVMAEALGAGFAVVEEGLPGRTTVLDDPIDGRHMNGLAYLGPCLGSHLPIDILVLMLGTNDLKARFSLPPQDIAKGMLTLCETALAWGAGPSGGPPKLVIVAPVPVVEAGWLAEIFAGGEAKSRRLAGYYAEIAGLFGAAFLDAGRFATVSPVDGVHFDPVEHRRLGSAMAELVGGLP